MEKSLQSTIRPVKIIIKKNFYSNILRNKIKYDIKWKKSQHLNNIDNILFRLDDTIQLTINMLISL